LKKKQDHAENSIVTLLSCVKSIPAYRRPVSHYQLQRKTANSLVVHIQCHVSYLSNFELSHLYEIVLTFNPDFDSFHLQYHKVLEMIIKYEYGEEIVAAISTGSPTLSDRKKKEPRDQKEKEYGNQLKTS
jgi:hypothetical protein